MKFLKIFLLASLFLSFFSCNKNHDKRLVAKWKPFFVQILSDGKVVQFIENVDGHVIDLQKDGTYKRYDNDVLVEKGSWYQEKDKLVT